MWLIRSKYSKLRNGDWQPLLHWYFRSVTHFHLMLFLQWLLWSLKIAGSLWTKSTLLILSLCLLLQCTSHIHSKLQYWPYPSLSSFLSCWYLYYITACIPSLCCTFTVVVMLLSRGEDHQYTPAFTQTFTASLGKSLYKPSAITPANFSPVSSKLLTMCRSALPLEFACSWTPTWTTELGFHTKESKQKWLGIIA